MCSSPTRSPSPGSSTWRASESGSPPTSCPFSEFERDAAAGTLPHFSLIEPNLLAGHSDYHPAFGRALLPGFEVPIDPPSSILAGEAFLARIYDAVRSAPSTATDRTSSTRPCSSAGTSPAAPMTMCRPGRFRRPTASAADGELGFRFDRSGYRVPAIIVSPWVEKEVVLTDEYRHTSMIATLREVWDLGTPFTGRDAAARTFHDVLSLDVPRDPDTWPECHAATGPRLPGGAGGRRWFPQHARQTPVPRSSPPRQGLRDVGALGAVRSQCRDLPGPGSRVRALDRREALPPAGMSRFRQ